MQQHPNIATDTIVIVLAGGVGKRLSPLTQDRSKPAVSFGGIYRIIDFSLSNSLNSGFRRIYVLTQYKSRSLERHIQLGWDSLFSPELGEWIFTVPPQLRVGQRWYEGTADAVFHNLDIVEGDNPARVIILSGDHIYKMNYRKLVEFHVDKGASATVAAVEVPLEQASAFGNLVVDDTMRITSFLEKPAEPIPYPGTTNTALANMGVYVFETDALIEMLRKDNKTPGSRHDFGRDILPAMTESTRLLAYPFVDENRKTVRYWRDVGTIDAYYEASMDQVAINPLLNVYDRDWPIRTLPRQLPPAKLVFTDSDPNGRIGIALNSLLCGGVIISGGRVEKSILGPTTRVHSYARVNESVLMDGVDVGRYAKVHRAIIDKRVQIAEGCVIGLDRDADRSRFTVSDNGIVVIPRHTRIECTGPPIPLPPPST